MEGKIQKILMTTDTVGGVWNYSVQLCRVLNEYGIEVHLAAMGSWPSEAQLKEVSGLKNTLLYKSDYKLEWMQDPWYDVEQAGKWLNSIYHTIQPQIIHFNNYAHLGKEWDSPTLTVFHSCVKTWWQAVKGTSAPSNWDKYSAAVAESLNSSDVVVAPTKAILKEAISTHGITSETKIIYNGIEIISSERNKKEDMILCIGRVWDEAKNLKSLSEIAKDLPWSVYVVGNNVDPNTGKTVEIENVNFLGELSQNEVSKGMQRASIFVSPTKYEPFGLAILEAASAGCALVLSKLDTLEELWDGAATFFNAEDKTEAEEKILQLINHEELRKELSEKAEKRSKDFSAERMGSEYISLYRELLSGTKISENQLSHSL